MIARRQGQRCIRDSVYREGSVVRAVDSDGRNDRVVIDIPAQLSRFLVDRSFLVGTWASPAPDGSRLALVASDFENLDTLPRGKQVEFAIYLLDPATRDLRLLVEDGVKPVWSPAVSYTHLTLPTTDLV